MLNSMVLRIGQTTGHAAIRFAVVIGGHTGPYPGGAIAALVMAVDCTGR